MKSPDLLGNEPFAFDMKRFKEMVEKIKQGNKAVKVEEGKNLLSMRGFITHYQNKRTKRLVLATCQEFEYAHEHSTLKKLAAEDYDVILVPKGYFNRHDKKFDAFLLREHIFLEADLKCIHSKNPDTIGKAIKNGTEQAQRLVIDIASSVERKVLIDGLRLGCQRNTELIEVMLFYNSSFYRLFKTQILGDRIFEVLKR